MNRMLILLAAGALLGLPLSAPAQESNLVFGGDQFASGETTRIDTPVENDAFLAGYDVTLTAPVGGDAHLAGFNVTSSSTVTGDLYAGGFSVSVTGPVSGDVTAMGNSVSLRAAEPVSGNARLAGQTVSVGSGGIEGSAVVAAQTLTLDGPIAGDLLFYGDSIVFTQRATVAGTLTIHAPEEIAVPVSVAEAARVRYEPLESPDYMGQAGRTAETVVRGFWPAFWAMLTWWLVLLVIGSGFIALMPRGLRAMEAAAARQPFRKLGLGILGFATVLGLIPVFAMTLIGIPLLPFVFVFAFIACSLAYLAGVYLAGSRLAGAFVALDTNLKRLGALAVSLVVAALLGMITFAGWLISLLFVVFGFGVIVAVLIGRGGSVPIPEEADAAV